MSNKTKFAIVANQDFSYSGNLIFRNEFVVSVHLTEKLARRAMRHAQKKYGDLFYIKKDVSQATRKNQWLYENNKDPNYKG